MNRKGFTLVELLAVIVIIGLIGAIATVSYTSLLENSRIRAFELYEETMYSDAMTLLATDTSLIPANKGTTHLTLSMLKTDPINNPRNKDDLCLTSYVDVKRDDYIDNNGKVSIDGFTYEVCLKCTNSNFDECVTFPKPTPTP